jgi:hypothetical protein
MDETEFKRATREMRSAQKQYFLTRSPKDLSTAKGWEKKVDDMLAAEAKPEQPVQGEIFG